MAYNNLISRTDAAALSTEVVNDIMLGKPRPSTVGCAGDVPADPAREQAGRMPVLSVLPTAYWVSGDTGLKQTTEANWDNTFLNVEEIAAIAPIPESVSRTPTWTSTVSSAADRRRDRTRARPSRPVRRQQAVVVPVRHRHGRNGGGEHRHAGNERAGKRRARRRPEPADRAGRGRRLQPDAAVARTSLRPALRGRYATTGENAGGVISRRNLGHPCRFRLRGAPGRVARGLRRERPADRRRLVAVDRRDPPRHGLPVITEGVITDNTGAIIYNLPQQDMVASA
jgi:hypothetical protein